MKHTPGPWHRNIPPATKYPTVFAGRNTHVAVVKVQSVSPEEAEANINLIAAAPELLQALKDVLPLIRYTSDNGWDEVKRARQLIDKVESI